MTFRRRAKGSIIEFWIAAACLASRMDDWCVKPVHRVQHTGTKSPCEHRKGQLRDEPVLEHKTTQQRQAPILPRGNQAYRWAWLGKVCWVVGRHSAGDETESGRSM